MPKGLQVTYKEEHNKSEFSISSKILKIQYYIFIRNIHLLV